jgi:hypothetical protein
MVMGGGHATSGDGSGCDGDTGATISRHHADQNLFKDMVTTWEENDAALDGGFDREGGVPLEMAVQLHDLLPYTDADELPHPSPAHVKPEPPALGADAMISASSFDDYMGSWCV